jgi:hypothetical protein
MTEDDVPDQRGLIPSAGACAGPLEASRQLDHWRRRTLAIKRGGLAMERADLRASFALDVLRLQVANSHPSDPWPDGQRWAGIEPAAKIAGRVVAAGGRMRREEERA